MIKITKKARARFHDFLIAWPIGTAIDNGLIAFDFGGVSVQSAAGVIKFVNNSFVPAATNYLNTWNFILSDDLSNSSFKP